MPNPPSCDWKNPKKNSAKEKAGKSNCPDKLIRHKGKCRWQGVKTDKYKTDASHWSMVLRRVLIGDNGEKTKFHLRYFEIAPGGFTSLEYHKHSHVVVGITGKGICLINNKKHKIGFLDTVYIGPNTVHNLQNPHDEPFGFFCIVDAKRDRPKIVKK